MFPIKTSLAAALVASAFAAAAAQPAAADSILYLKGGDVWLSTSDGARQHQVTRGGGYSSAAQGDDGTIVALAGQRVHRLDRSSGAVLADLAAPAPGTARIDLSHDGTLVAAGTDGASPRVAVARTDGGAAPMPGADGWSGGSWGPGSLLVLSGTPSDALADVALLDERGAVHQWFGDAVGTGERQAELSRQGTMVAAVGDNGGGQELFVWRVPGLDFWPAFCHSYGGAVGGTFSSPSWSPDGTRLAWAEGSGINVATQGCPTTDNGALVIPGGTEPDWGAADVPVTAGGPGVPRPVLPGGPGTTGQGTPGGAPGTPAGPRGDGAAAPRPRTGASVAIACHRACTVRGRVVVRGAAARRLGVRSGATVAAGSARAARKGRVTLKLTPTAAGRKAAAKLAGARLTAKVTVVEAGRTRRLTRTVTLA